MGVGGVDGRTLVVAFSLVTSGIGGCAHRSYLDHDALARTQANEGMDALRVYPDETIVSVYGAPEAEGSAEVERVKTIVSRNTAGLVVDVGQPDASELWVTFDPSCTETTCAYRFGQTTDGRYRLVEVPARDGFAEVRTFRGREAEDRHASLGETAGPGSDNDIYLTAQP